MSLTALLRPLCAHPLSNARTAPLTIPPGGNVLVTVRASTRTSLAPGVAAGLLALAGLGVALRCRKHLLAVSTLLLLVVAACSAPAATGAEVKLTAKLVEVHSNTNQVPVGLPASGPDITVEY